MNRIYRLVVNHSLNLVQVASELGSEATRSRGLRNPSKAQAAVSAKPLPARTPLAVALALILAAPLIVATPAQAVTITTVTGAAGGPGNPGTAAAPGTGGTGTGSGAYVNDGGTGGTTSFGSYGGPGGAGYGPGGSGGEAISKVGGGFDYGGGGGGGGAPGYAASGSGSYQLNLGTSVTGGAGGAAGAGYASGIGGLGGYGGDGFYGKNFNISTSGNITGGAGGVGGDSSFIPAPGGNGGAGVSGSSFFVTNSGTIAGGDGGSSGMQGGTGGVLGNRGGFGGPGIYSSRAADITNGGVIRGGVNGAGDTSSSGAQADAIRFSGGLNRLNVTAGASFVGNIISTSGTTSGGDTLSLFGNTSASLTGTFATSDPGSYGSAPVFAGFQLLAKSGASTWTITTVTDTTANAIPNWEVDSGILQLASGNNFNPSSTDVLTLTVNSSSSTAATPGVDNGELTTTGKANLNGETLTVAVSGTTYLSGTIYQLVHAGGGVSGTFGSVSYILGTFGSGVSSNVCYTSTDVYLVLASSCSGVSGGGGSSGGGGALGFLSMLGLLGLSGFGRGVSNWNRKSRANS